jgi:hypothetical protein
VDRYHLLHQLIFPDSDASGYCIHPCSAPTRICPSGSGRGAANEEIMEPHVINGRLFKSCSNITYSSEYLDS